MTVPTEKAEAGLVRDPEQMTDDEKLATIIGVSGVAPIGSEMALEYEPRIPSYPSAMLAWYLAIVSVIFFPAALAAVPLAIRTARQGNPHAWMAAVLAVVAFGVNIALFLALR